MNHRGMTRATAWSSEMTEVWDFSYLEACVQVPEISFCHICRHVTMIKHPELQNCVWNPFKKINLLVAGEKNAKSYERHVWLFNWNPLFIVFPSRVSWINEGRALEVDVSCKIMEINPFTQPIPAEKQQQRRHPLWRVSIEWWNLIYSIRYRCPCFPLASSIGKIVILNGHRWMFAERVVGDLGKLLNITKAKRHGFSTCQRCKHSNDFVEWQKIATNWTIMTRLVWM